MNIRRLLILLLALLLPIAALAEAPPVIRYLDADDPRPAIGEGLLEMHLIDVASADCILLRMGDRTMLVDSGNRGTANRVLDYLQSIGVDRLDYVFATHPHTDHIAAFAEIMRAVPVGMYIQPEMFAYFHSGVNDELMAVTDELGIPKLYTHSGVMMMFGEATLAFYQWEDSTATINDRSMIVLVRLGRRAALLAADIENNGQKALAAAYGDALRADIIKMPHHGLAAYMRELHAAVKPSLVTYSNVKSKIQRNIGLTEQRGVDWMLTTNGTIVAVTDGETWTVWQTKNERR